MPATTFDPHYSRPYPVPTNAWWCDDHNCYHGGDVDYYRDTASVAEIAESRVAGARVAYFSVPEPRDAILDSCGCDLCRSRRPVADDNEYEDDGSDYYEDGDSSAEMIVHSYSYKPDPIFLGTGPLYLGAEIEVECKYDYSTDHRGKAIAAIAKYLADERVAYLKTDGSLSNGVEIVTHPMSYEWAIENFPWEMFGPLGNFAYTDPENTGLHVHVSRAGFRSQFHTMSWMRFVYEHKRQVVKLAGRNSDHWATFQRQATDLAYAAKGGTDLARYRAINVQNDNTLEVRVFGSSTDPEQVKATLGFMDASVRFAGTLSAHDALTKKRSRMWGDFTEYVTSHDKYEPLTKRFRALDLIPA